MHGRRRCTAPGAPKVARDASKEELLDFCQKKYGLRLWSSPDAGDASPAEPPSKADGSKPSAPEARRPPRKPAAAVEKKPQTTPPGQSIHFWGFDDFVEACAGQPAEPPRAVEPAGVHDMKDLIDLGVEPGADDLKGCLDVLSPKVATQQGLEPLFPHPEAWATPAWQPKGPESDDLWVEWGTW